MAAKKKVAVLAARDYEDLELWYPLLRLREAGAEVVVLRSTGQPEVCLSKHGYPVQTQGLAGDMNPDEFDGVVVPGGWAPDRLRRCFGTLEFVRKIFANGKVTAGICHGPSVLISAGVVADKNVTSAVAIKDDLVNAGASWQDEKVIVDGNLVTAQGPSDLPEFCKAILAQL